MSAKRHDVLLLLLILTATVLSLLGARVFHAPHPASLQVSYGLGAVVILGWLGYFGSKS